MLGRLKTDVRIQSNEVLFILNSRTRKQALTKLCELQVNELDLSFRAYNLLVRAKMVYIKDIDLYELAKRDGVGMKTIEEIQEKLLNRYRDICKKINKNME